MAAVFNPDTDAPCFMMTPAPRKPIPETIWAATRVGSASGPWKLNAPITTNSAAPRLTSAFVRTPAVRDRHWRSSPIRAPQPTASSTRSAMS